MFAIDCLKSNGTHLGTCIDRFYFGSCCQLKVCIISSNVSRYCKHNTHARKRESSAAEREKLHRVVANLMQQQQIVCLIASFFLLLLRRMTVKTSCNLKSTITASMASCPVLCRPQIPCQSCQIAIIIVIATRRVITTVRRHHEPQLVEM